MSRQLKRQISKAQGGRGRNASPARRKPATPGQRMNRYLLIGGGVLALGAVMISLTARHFDPMGLGINLGAIGVGLLMGKGIGRFIFRRVLP